MSSFLLCPPFLSCRVMIYSLYISFLSWSYLDLLWVTFGFSFDFSRFSLNTIFKESRGQRSGRCHIKWFKCRCGKKKKKMKKKEIRHNFCKYRNITIINLIDIIGWIIWLKNNSPEIFYYWRLSSRQMQLLSPHLYILYSEIERNGHRNCNWELYPLLLLVEYINTENREIRMKCEKWLNISAREIIFSIFYYRFSCFQYLLFLLVRKTNKIW